MRSITGIQRAFSLLLAFAFTPAFAPTDECSLFSDPAAFPRMMRFHDQIRNRDPGGQPLIPAFAEATALVQEHRWADALPLLVIASQTQPPPVSTEQQRQAIYLVGEDSRQFAQDVADCTWMMPNGLSK